MDNISDGSDHTARYNVYEYVFLFLQITDLQRLQLSVMCRLVKKDSYTICFGSSKLYTRVASAKKNSITDTRSKSMWR